VGDDGTLEVKVMTWPRKIEKLCGIGEAAE